MLARVRSLAVALFASHAQTVLVVIVSLACPHISMLPHTGVWTSAAADASSLLLMRQTLLWCMTSTPRYSKRPHACSTPYVYSSQCACCPALSKPSLSSFALVIALPAAHHLSYSSFWPSAGAEVSHCYSAAAAGIAV